MGNGITSSSWRVTVHISILEILRNPAQEKKCMQLQTDLNKVLISLTILNNVTQNIYQHTLRSATFIIISSLRLTSDDLPSLADFSLQRSYFQSYCHLPLQAPPTCQVYCNSLHFYSLELLIEPDEYEVRLLKVQVRSFHSLV